jgi:hypothetical protein
MWLRLPWFSGSEDRLDAWVTQHHQGRVLEGRSKPTGPCPDAAFLMGLAGRSKQIALSDPRVDHAANCPACMGRLLDLRSASQSRQRRLALAAALACCCVLGVTFVVLSRRRANMPQSPSEMAATPVTVDLWNDGTLRNSQPNPAQTNPTQLNPMQSLSLPAAFVKATIILPRYSEAGRYTVAVTRDETGNEALARASAAATGNGDREEVSVSLDLRKTRPGSYFLSTTHEQDQASYYYPLQIR